MATFVVDMPPQTSNPSELARYLYRLVETLNETLNNIDADNMNTAYQTAITAAVSVSDKAKQLSELLDKNELAKTKSVREMYSSLRDSVFSRVDNVTAAFSSLIDQTRSEIKTYVEANFIASDPDMSLDEKISSMIQQTANQIRFEFSTLATINVDAVNDLLVKFGMYFRFTDKGLEIGKIGDDASPLVTRITNERIEFVIAGTDTVVVYIDGATNKLHINSAEVDMLSIGSNSHGYFDFDMGASGLHIKFRG